MPRLTFFNLFYSSTFTLLSLLTLALVLVPPGDAIAQSLVHTKQLYNVFLIAGTYVLTTVIAIVLYTSRMYTFHRLLADIPKSRVLISRADLPRRVHATVTRGITRSAYVALVSRPSAAQGMEHVWGHINHAGWAPPDGELKGVEYRSIVGELPALLQLEANAAVARVAADPGVAHRPPHVTLRQWMENLVGMELAPREETEVFLALYERARFRMRGKGIAEGEFRALMKGLKAVLGGMGAAVDARGATGYAHIPGTDGGEEGHDGYPASIRVEDESYARFRRAAGYGRYETSLSTEYGYTPERVDTGDTSYHPNVAEGTSTMIMPPMGRTRTTSSMSGVPRIRDISGDGGGQVIELTEMRRRQLGARLSTGTFG